MAPESVYPRVELMGARTAAWKEDEMDAKWVVQWVLSTAESWAGYWD
jgi:hypothetical protein